MNVCVTLFGWSLCLWWSKHTSESTVAPETITQAEQLFEHYEQLRVLFVNDKGEGYAEPINSLVTKY